MNRPTRYGGKLKRRIRVVLVGLALIFAGIIWLFQSGRTTQAKWIFEAQTAVEGILRTSNRIPAEMRERLGPFQHLSGEGWGRAVWNIQGYHYLQADRDAHFANATIPVRIYVTEGRKTSPESQEIMVKTVEKDQSSLYLIDAPRPKLPTEGLRIVVSHPDLKF